MFTDPAPFIVAELLEVETTLLFELEKVKLPSLTSD